jgi:hypothetical protein
LTVESLHCLLTKKPSLPSDIPDHNSRCRSDVLTSFGMAGDASGAPCPAGSFCTGGDTLPLPCSATHGNYCPAGIVHINAVLSLSFCRISTVRFLGCKAQKKPLNAIRASRETLHYES